jgi:hypothetical protein
MTSLLCATVIAGQTTEMMSPRQLFVGPTLSSYASYRADVVNVSNVREDTVEVITTPGVIAKYRLDITRLTGTDLGGDERRFAYHHGKATFGQIGTGAYLLVSPTTQLGNVKVVWGEVPRLPRESEITNAVMLPDATCRPREGESADTTIWRAVAVSWVRVADTDFWQLLNLLPPFQGDVRAQAGTGGTQITRTTVDGFRFLKEIAADLPAVKRLQLLGYIAKSGDPSIAEEYENLLWQNRELPNIRTAAAVGPSLRAIGDVFVPGQELPKSRSEFINKAKSALDFQVKIYYVQNSKPVTPDSRKLLASMLKSEKSREVLTEVVRKLDRYQPGGPFFRGENLDALEKNLDFYVDHYYKKFGG